VLALVEEFQDSSTMAEELRYDGQSALRARGIDLPENVAISVVGTPGQAVLRAEVRVGNVIVHVDWDPEVGAITQVHKACL